MKKILPIILMLTALVACNDKDMFNNIHIKPNTSIPIGTAIISDTTLFRVAGLKNEIKTNSDGVLFFAVDGENKLIGPANINRIFSFQPQNFPFNVQLPLPVDPGQQVPVLGGDLLPINLKLGQRIEQLRMNSAKVTLTITEAGDYSNFKCTMPEITKNGVPLVLQPNQPVMLDESYIIKPQYSEGHKTHYMALSFSGTAPYSPQLRGAVAITETGPAYVEGFFGSETVITSSSVVEPADDSFFKFTSQAKSAYFADPSIDIQLNSTVNIPVMIRVINVLVDNQKVPLKMAYNCDRFLVKAEEAIPKFRVDNAATITGNAFSDAITKDFKKITITVEVVINPTAADLLNADYVPPTHNSLTKNDVIELYYTVNLPFDCNLQGIKFVQEIQLNLTDIAQDPNQEYEELAMLIGGYNQLPMSLEINPFVAQGNNPNAERTYLFAKPFVINGAGDNLKPSDPKFKPYKMDNSLSFVIDQSKTDKLLLSSKLFLDINASTAPSQTNAGPTRTPTRKFYSPCELGLDIVIGAKADINVTPSNK